MHDLSLHLLDLLENSSRAGATRIAVSIAADRPGDRLTITVDDDGVGLPVAPEQAVDPFFTTKTDKRTGLGLSLFRQAAEAAGGGLRAGRSDALGGTSVTAWMDLANLDRPPLGDVSTSLLTMIATNPQTELTLTWADGDERFELRGSELPRRLAALVARQKALP
jgi:hypothetical protein